MSVHRITRSCAASLVGAVSVLLGMLIGADPVRGQDAGSALATLNDSLRLRSAMFGFKYRLGDDREQYAIDPWIGLSMRRAFTDILATNGAALAEAERAKPYLIMRFVGSMGAVLGFAKLSFDALESTRSSSSQLGDDSLGDILTDVLLYVGAPLVVGLIGTSRAKAHLEEAVSIYNAGPRSVVAADQAGTASRSGSQPVRASEADGPPSNAPPSGATPPRAISVHVAPSYQSLHGDDYQGVNNALGFEAMAQYNFGRNAIGVGYRRHSHGLDFSSAGVTLPRGAGADLVIDGFGADYRRTFVVDEASRATLYLRLYGSMLNQSVGVAAQGARAAFESTGFGAGSGVGGYYQLSPIIDLSGEWTAGVISFGEFEALQGTPISTSTGGMTMMFKVGARLRLTGASPAR